MLKASSIETMPTDLAHVHAFRITGQVDRDDMAEMSEHMLKVFEDHDEVDMLLVFDTDKTSTAGAGWSMDAMKAQAESLSKVRNYVVANAPGQAGGIVETMGSAMPVNAKAFDTEDEALAWLHDQPAPNG